MVSPETSKLILKPILTLLFVDNIARKMGGLIYYLDSVFTDIILIQMNASSPLTRFLIIFP